MIPESGTYQQLKHAVLEALPNRKLLWYEIVGMDGRRVRTFYSLGEAISALRRIIIETGQTCTIHSRWD
jgi:hypothetical protein